MPTVLLRLRSPAVAVTRAAVQRATTPSSSASPRASPSSSTSRTMASSATTNPPPPSTILGVEHLPLSTWLPTPPADLQPPLPTTPTPHVYDIVIIGGGYTGLSAALHLHRHHRGRSVALLESEFAGFGASGRNAGHLTPTIGKDLPTLLAMHGERKSIGLVRFAEASVRAAEANLSELGIDAEYVDTGNIVVAVHASHERRLRGASRVAARHGLSVEYLEAAEMRRRGIPRAFVGGMVEQCGGTLDPGKYVMGLRRATIRAGVPLFEGTRVAAMKDGTDGVTLTTADGAVVKAGKVILATNAFAPGLAKPLGGLMVPLHITLAETEPLTQTQIDLIGGWKSREGLYTAHEVMESFRLTARNTIAFGSKSPRFERGGAVRGWSGAAQLGPVIQSLRDRFPELPDLRVARTWGGWIDITLSFVPVVSVLDKRTNNVHYAIGYNGHGIAGASLLGRVVADAAVGEPNEYLPLFQSKLPIPPEPFKSLAVRGLLGAFQWYDRRLDAQLRKMRASA
ncbi:FAD dependent oxidoreductase [Zopfochytrium polystomum]|nr:FAD dependent oxidoreductase [Zopfochytrium polystomum]